MKKYFGLLALAVPFLLAKKYPEKSRELVEKGKQKGEELFEKGKVKGEEFMQRKNSEFLHCEECECPRHCKRCGCQLDKKKK